MIATEVDEDREKLGHRSTDARIVRVRPVALRSQLLCCPMAEPQSARWDQRARTGEAARGQATADGVDSDQVVQRLLRLVSLDHHLATVLQA